MKKLRNVVGPNFNLPDHALKAKSLSFVAQCSKNDRKIQDTSSYQPDTIVESTLSGRSSGFGFSSFSCSYRFCGYLNIFPFSDIVKLAVIECVLELLDIGI